MAFVDGVTPYIDKRLLEEQLDSNQSILITEAGHRAASAAIRHLMHPEQPELDDIFRTGINGASPLTAMNSTPADFVQTLSSPRDREEFLEASGHYLSGLPFVHLNQMEWYRRIWKQSPRVIVAGNLEVPAERVIGANSFSNWTGVRLPEGAKLPYDKSDVFQLGPGSLNAITTFALLDESTRPQYSPDNQAENSGPVLVIAKDTADEYWGVVDLNGKHRVAAQKLQGRDTIQVHQIHVYDDDVMPLIQMGVRKNVAMLVNR